MSGNVKINVGLIPICTFLLCNNKDTWFPKDPLKTVREVDYTNIYLL